MLSFAFSHSFRSLHSNPSILWHIMLVVGTQNICIDHLWLYSVSPKSQFNRIEWMNYKVSAAIEIVAESQRQQKRTFITHEGVFDPLKLIRN